MLKISLLFKTFTNFTGKMTSDFLGLRNRNFQGIVFMNTNIQGDFQIYISVPLMATKMWLKIKN